MASIDQTQEFDSRLIRRGVPPPRTAAVGAREGERGLQPPRQAAPAMTQQQQTPQAPATPSAPPPPPLQAAPMATSLPPLADDQQQATLGLLGQASTQHQKGASGVQNVAFYVDSAVMVSEALMHTGGQQTRWIMPLSPDKIRNIFGIAPGQRSVLEICGFSVEAIVNGTHVPLVARFRFFNAAAVRTADGAMIGPADHVLTTILAPKPDGTNRALLGMPRPPPVADPRLLAVVGRDGPEVIDLSAALEAEGGEMAEQSPLRVVTNGITDPHDPESRQVCIAAIGDVQTSLAQDTARVIVDIATLQIELTPTEAGLAVLNATYGSVNAEQIAPITPVPVGITVYAEYVLDPVVNPPGYADQQPAPASGLYPTAM